MASKPGSYTVTGVVRLEGTPPKRQMLPMTQDPKCVALHGAEHRLNEDVLVGDSGAVQNAFVYVNTRIRGDYAAPKQPAVLAQKRCMYTPRVQGIRVGQTLRMTNSDPLTHNIRSFPTRDDPFNIGQIGPGTREKVFSAAEPAVKFKCDIHPWMTAYIFVMDHPFFATTDASGRFAIRDLPPGEYKLAAWHEVFGQQGAALRLTDRDPAAVNFTFTTGQK